jgi:hypothetical protein
MKYYIYPKFKIESFGSPFRNEDSGVAEDDEENNKRFEKGILLYSEQFRKERGLPGPEYWDTHTRYIYPFVWAAPAYILFRMYTRPSSRYIRKVMPLLFANFGFFLGMKHERNAQNQFLLRNYGGFTKSVREALHTGDARYLRHILKEHGIGYPNQKAEPVSEKKTETK